LVEFTVKIISIDKENGKLILSERAAFERERYDALANLKVGDTVEGTVSGIVKFGIFVAFGGLEGLVHISEIAWGTFLMLTTRFASATVWK
jgi:small subunit ribosomal protein S1